MWRDKKNNGKEVENKTKKIVDMLMKEIENEKKGRVGEGEKIKGEKRPGEEEKRRGDKKERK